MSDLKCNAGLTHKVKVSQHVHVETYRKFCKLKLISIPKLKPVTDICNHICFVLVTISVECKRDKIAETNRSKRKTENSAIGSGWVVFKSKIKEFTTCT